MQIPPSQWTSAASSALPQQGARAVANSQVPQSASTSPGIEQIAEGDQAQDRDADEKYAGNGGRRPSPRDASPPGQTAVPVVAKAIELAATDPEPPAQFESWG